MKKQTRVYILYYYILQDDYCQRKNEKITEQLDSTIKSM